METYIHFSMHVECGSPDMFWKEKMLVTKKITGKNETCTLCPVHFFSEM
jgi:hypothetical protein